MPHGGGSTSPDSLLDRARDRDLGSIAEQGVGAWMLAVAAGFISGSQAVLHFLFLPFEILVDVSIAGANAFFIEPLLVVRAGVIGSINAILAEAQLIDLPLAVVVVLVTFLIIAWFLSFAFTGGLIPNVLVDNPLVNAFTSTPEEESEDE